MVKDGRIHIQGIAAREGISKNQRKYTAKELKKFAPTLIGRPILRDHESLTENVIGKVTHAESIDGGKTVTYKGWIKGAEDIERIKDGRISEVSIGAFSKKIVKEDKDDDFVIPVDMSAMELSTTPTPGIDGTSLTISNNQNENYSEEQLKEMISVYKTIKLTEEDLKDIKVQIKKEDKELDLQIINNSHSKSLDKDDLNINKREETMEAKKDAKSTEENAEVLAMKEQIESYKAKLKEAEDGKEEAEKEKEEAEKEAEEAKESLRTEAISKYEVKAESKGAKIMDLSKSNMEAIKFAIEMVDSLPEPKAEEPADEKGEEKEEEEEEPKKDELKDEPKEDDEESSDEDESKEKATLRTKKINSKSPTVIESLEGYTLTQEGCDKGFAFYRNY